MSVQVHTGEVDYAAGADLNFFRSSFITFSSAKHHYRNISWEIFSIQNVLCPTQKQSKLFPQMFRSHFQTLYMLCLDGVCQSGQL